MRAISIGAISFKLNIRVITFCGLALLAVVGLGVWGVTLGSLRLPISEVVTAIVGEGTRQAEFIVVDLRMPRIVVAGFVGLMLAMSGAIFQGLVRNPLVSPDIIGINAGASVFAVYWIVARFPVQYLPIVAFAGAVAAAAAIYVLSWRGRISGARLVLVGIGMNALLSALITLLVVTSDINDVSRAYQWLAGSVYGSDWSDIRSLVAWTVVLVPTGVILMWSLRVIQTGDIMARSVGMRVERVRLALILVGCGLSAIAVAAAGPVGFVALMAPHAARMIAGPMTGGVFVFTGLLGALLVIGADLIGQHALPVTLPVGILTAALGAPYFLFLLYRTNARM